MNMSITSAGGAGMPNAVSGASMQMPPQGKMTNLYNRIDTTGAGAISQNQFMNAFQTMNPPGPFKSAGADAVWNALDPNGSGQVSKTDFVNTMKTLMHQLRQSMQSVSQTATAGTSGLNGITV